MTTLIAVLALALGAHTAHAWDLDPATQRTLSDLHRELERAQKHPNGSMQERLEWQVRSALLDIRTGVVEASEARYRAALPPRREDWTPEQRAGLEAIRARKDLAYDAAGAAADMNQLYGSPDAIQLLRQYTTCVEGRKKAFLESTARLDVLMTAEETGAEKVALAEALKSLAVEVDSLKRRLETLKAPAEIAAAKFMIQSKDFTGTRFAERLRSLGGPG